MRLNSQRDRKVNVRGEGEGLVTSLTTTASRDSLRSGFTPHAGAYDLPDVDHRGTHRRVLDFAWDANAPE